MEEQQRHGYDRRQVKYERSHERDKTGRESVVEGSKESGTIRRNSLKYKGQRKYS